MSLERSVFGFSFRVSTRSLPQPVNPCKDVHSYAGRFPFSFPFVNSLPLRVQKLGLTTEVLRGLSCKLPASRRRLGLQATEELFDSAVQEVMDETNVPRTALGVPLLSGIVRQGNSFGAPTAGM